jgi:uncharacterized membrane protein
LDPVQRNVETVARLEEAGQAQVSRLDRVSDAITQFIGSLPFLALHLVWIACWIGWNVAPPPARHFDPLPFNLLGVVVSIEAIILSSFILITQNRMQRLVERRSHLELQINMLAEQEATKMLEMLASIQEHLGIGTPDAEVAALQQTTEPERLMEQLEQHGPVPGPPPASRVPGSKEAPPAQRTPRTEP